MTPATSITQEALLRAVNVGGQQQGAQEAFGGAL